MEPETPPETDVDEAAAFGEPTQRGRALHASLLGLGLGAILAILARGRDGAALTAEEPPDAPLRSPARSHR